MASGCASHPALSFPNVPSPVLLGPVDRIGGATATAPASARLDVEVEHAFTAGRYGGHAKREEVRKASFAALEVTAARKDTDVHLDGVHTGGWFFSMLAGHYRDEWVSATGDVRRAP